MKPARTAESVAVRTLTNPLAPLPTTAFILVPVVSENFVKEVAATPPNRTCVTFARLLPLMITVWPVVALVGEKEVMVVCACRVKEIPPQNDEKVKIRKKSLEIFMMYCLLHGLE